MSPSRSSAGRGPALADRVQPLTGELAQHERGRLVRGVSGPALGDSG
ncbi:hypothetical protein [Streptomyces sp. NPDC006195]